MTTALQNLGKAVQELNSQSRLAARQGPRITQVQEALDRQQTRWYKIFCDFLEGVDPFEKQLSQTGAFDILWDALPKPPATLDHKKIANVLSPGDGLIFKADDIEKATNVLRDYHNAWSTAFFKSPDKASPKVGNLTTKAKICLVLNVLKERRLLEYFCKPDFFDVRLPLQERTLESIFRDFGEESSYFAQRFLTEQYRVVSRNWSDGVYIEIPPAEPLPFLVEKYYGSGSYGTVHGVLDVWTGERYARKQQDVEDGAEHFRKEKETLERIDHRHIVKYVKAFKRGGEYSLLLKPAADGNLKELLDLYQSRINKPATSSQKEAKDLRIAIMTAFGCLSHALCHVHRNTSIIHKDIKPNNILFDRQEGPPRYTNILLADFGLAHDFSKAEHSGTGHLKMFSKRYAAPPTWEDLNTDQDSPVSSRATPLRSVSSQTGLSIGLKSTASAKTSKKPPHGRKDDIFSFGCVFFEILSVLTGSKVPGITDPDFEFCQQLGVLQRWAEREMSKKSCPASLHFLFDLALEMTRWSQDERPGIGELTRKLIHSPFATEYFCPKCIPEVEAELEASKLKDPVQRYSNESGNTADSIPAISEMSITIEQGLSRATRHDGHLSPSVASSSRHFSA